MPCIEPWRSVMVRAFMPPDTLSLNSPSDIMTLEDFYTALALAIDDVGSDKETLLLSKLALLLAHELNQPQRAIALIEEAKAEA